MIIVYIDDKILNHREFTIDRNRNKGTILLSNLEINALSHYFTRIGVRRIDNKIMQVSGYDFTLTVFDDDNILFKIYSCTFYDPPTIIINDDSDLIPVEFSYRADSELFPSMNQINTGHIDQCGVLREALD